MAIIFPFNLSPSHKTMIKLSYLEDSGFFEGNSGSSREGEIDSGIFFQKVSLPPNMKNIRS